MEENKGDKIIATRLIVKIPSYLTHHQKSEITITAIDSKGRIDRIRNDEIEITMEPIYEKIEDTKVKLDTNHVRLVNGVAKIGVSSHQSEFVKITASCKDKKTKIKSYTVLMATGGYPFHK